MLKEMHLLVEAEAEAEAEALLPPERDLEAALDLDADLAPDLALLVPQRSRERTTASKQS